MPSIAFCPAWRVFGVAAAAFLLMTDFAHAAAPGKAKLASASYGKLPLSFEQRPAAANGRTEFMARGEGYSILLDGQSALLALRPAKVCDEAGAGDRKTAPVCSGKPDVIRMTLAGARAGATQGRGEAELPGKVNYFVGNDPAQWRTDIPTYGRVRWNGVYPGVDLAYYGNQGQLEYDFVVAPGASATGIRMKFSGDDRPHMTLGENGALVLKVADGEVSFHKPVLYQAVGGRRQPVEGGFRLLAGGTVGFSVGAYDHSKPLVIDPVLVYSTYLGGSGQGDRVNAIALDAAGNAYVAGSTTSPAFPVTGGALQKVDPAGTELASAFVSKLNAAGTALLYSTYLGGTLNSGVNAIAVDASGNAYVAGFTFATNFPVTCGAAQLTNLEPTRSASTGFVSKLNAAGTALLYSTYLGGSGTPSPYPPQGDAAQAIAIDGSGDAFVTGYTYSPDFPVTSGVFQTRFRGGPYISNAFVTKVNPAGTGFVYSTYLGGNGTYTPSAGGDVGNAIALDYFGHAIVVGTTSSSNFPVTTYALQTSLLGQANAFVAELNIAGVGELYGTYLGGTSSDSGLAVALGGDGSVYVAGYASSSDFPTTSGVLEGPGAFPGASAAFVTKFTIGNASPIYSTYVEGASDSTSMMGLAVDGNGAAYLVGSAPTSFAGNSGGFISTADALAVPTGSYAAYVVKLDPSGATLNYASLLGGSGNDSATAVALDSSGNAYVAGYTGSSDFPITAGAFQRTWPGYVTNGFISKLAIGSEANQTPYPARPPGLIQTSMGVWGGISNVQCLGDQGEYYDVCFGFGMEALAPGPAPTGTINFSGTPIDGPFLPYPQVFGDSFCYNLNYNPAPGPVYLDVSATYSGDSVYSGSSDSASYEDDSCPSNPDGPQVARKSARKPFRLGRLTAAPAHDLRALLEDKKLRAFHGYKFELPSLPTRAAQAEASRVVAADSATAACIVVVPRPPVFTPGAGTYVTKATVTLTDSTPGARIYYAVNGVTPTASSTLYTAPIALTSTTTIKAIAVGAGSAQSTVTSALFTIVPVAATPVFKPASGAYPAGQQIVLTTATPGATIYYALHGATPTTSSTKYTGPITLSATSTIKAIAVAPGYGQSAVVSAQFTVQPVVSTPVFSPVAGTYAKGQKVTITSATHGATLYYALHGATPTTASTKYVGPIPLTVTTTIKVIAVANGYLTSPVATATFTIK